ncbi:MAG TPA: hypothetical protein VMU17_01490 [Elusimicrobiota bacterium]|nr:hypothetical protein [Elusimicrobiota bacterium]
MPDSIAYKLTGRPRRKTDHDLPPIIIDLAHIPLPDLQRIFHVGPANVLIEGRRHVNREKAERLQAYCADSIDVDAYHWEFVAFWTDQNPL